MDKLKNKQFIVNSANELSDIAVKHGNQCVVNFLDYMRKTMNVPVATVNPITALVNTYVAVKTGTMDRTKAAEKQKEIFEAYEVE